MARLSITNKSSKRPAGIVLGRYRPRRLIIDRWNKRPAWARRLDWILTGLMWLLYLYLIRQALVSLYDLIRETFGWIVMGDARPHLPVVSAFFATVGNYGVVVLANGLILIIWAYYNQLRFRGVNRRHPRKPIGIPDLATLYDFPGKDVETWQQSRILVMQHNPDGTLINVLAKDKSVTLATLPA